MAASRLTTVKLEPQDLEALERLASKEQRTVEQIITIAIRDYVARRHRDMTDWQQRWDEIVTRIRSGVPPDVTPEEIEADIREARREVREARRAARHD